MTRSDAAQWCVILRARGNSAEARAALDVLCRAYRTPVLAYIRHHGYSADVAEDLTQAFFTRFLEHAWHAHADPTRGSFRAFLLTAVRRFLINAEEEGHAIKRGGHLHFESIDGSEGALEEIASNDATPERAFERAWAWAIIELALRRLRDEAAEAGKGDLFDRLRDFLIEPPDEADYARVAATLKQRRNTVAVAVHRLRQRLRELVGEELAATTAGGSDLDDELRQLRTALGPVLHEGSGSDTR